MSFVMILKKIDRIIMAPHCGMMFVSNFSVGSAPADGLAPLGAKTSADVNLMIQMMFYC